MVLVFFNFHHPPFATNYCLLAGLGAPPKPLVSPASDGVLQGGLRQGLLKGLLSSPAAIQPIRRYAICNPNGWGGHHLLHHQMVMGARYRLTRLSVPLLLGGQYLRNGGSLETAQQMAGHESSRTTGLYVRTGDEVTLDEVERIAI